MKRNKLIPINSTLSNFFFGFPPLVMGYIASLIPDHRSIEITDENFDTTTFKDCDLVGVTGFTSTATRACLFVQMPRERQVPVVMGGIHASIPTSYIFSRIMAGHQFVRTD